MIEQLTARIASAEPSAMDRDRFSSDDPRAPYTVFRDEQEMGIYTTRAEARRRQQQLESEQPDGTGRICIRDIDDKVVI